MNRLVIEEQPPHCQATAISYNAPTQITTHLDGSETEMFATRLEISCYKVETRDVNPSEEPEDLGRMAGVLVTRMCATCPYSREYRKN